MTNIQVPPMAAGQQVQGQPQVQQPVQGQQPVQQPVQGLQQPIQQPIQGLQQNVVQPQSTGKPNPPAAVPVLGNDGRPLQVSVNQGTGTVVARDGFSWDDFNFKAGDVKTPWIKIGYNNTKEVVDGNHQLVGKIFSPINNQVLGDAQTSFMFIFLAMRHYLKTDLFDLQSDPTLSNPIKSTRVVQTSENSNEITPYEGYRDVQNNTLKRTKEETCFAVLPVINNQILPEVHVLIMSNANQRNVKGINQRITALMNENSNNRPWELMFGLNLAQEIGKKSGKAYYVYNNLKAARHQIPFDGLGYYEKAKTVLKTLVFEYDKFEETVAQQQQVQQQPIQPQQQQFNQGLAQGQVGGQMPVQQQQQQFQGQLTPQGQGFQAQQPVQQQVPVQQQQQVPVQQQQQPVQTPGAKVNEQEQDMSPFFLGNDQNQSGMTPDQMTEETNKLFPL